ncbi:hypothetical protein [Thomasclavelia spiroformis]|uniref:hypothetical protein n=1 Tax=Thomasclavelia spiroformis TaxID=29348 RepID=UPI00399197D6
MDKKIDTIKKITKTRKNINKNYDLSNITMEDIKQNSFDLFDLITNAFTFGYYQGVKAQKRGRAFVISQGNSIR